MELNDYYTNNAADWLKQSIKSLISHHRKDNKGFIRSSNQISRKDAEIFPTATFQGYAAILECYDICKSEEFTLKNIITELTSIIKLENIDNYLKVSNNGSNRSIILFEQLLRVLSYIDTDKNINITVPSEILQQYHIVKSAITFTTIKKIILGENEDMDIKEQYYYPDAGRSPWFLLTILNCQKYCEMIYGESSKLIVGKKHESNFDINSLIDSHINYHMARYNVKELSFDPVSLVIAICCKIKIDDNFRTSPFFISCLKAITEQQYSDGCWPTGATISFNESCDVIQQASIQIASHLADSIVDYKFLIDCNDNIEEILDIIIPSFRKLANYMIVTFENIQSMQLSGWSSDRIKVRDYTETWITSYACRFFHKYLLIEKAYLRIKALKNLGVNNYVYNKKDTEKKTKFWENEIIETDSILKPKETINQIIYPIINERTNGNLLITPSVDNLSFIICGPPGSGKTFIVEKMSEVLGWPLVELSPSQFIKNGLEFIESTSKEIFNSLYHLHHAVVFFDECDELFRDRSSIDVSFSNRTILNFLTASMLPKLQKLHDKKSVIFVVGTNYLHKMDSAVRRKGRFDYRILFDRPDEVARKSYYLKHKEEGTSIEVDIDSFIKKTHTVLTKDLFKYFRASQKEEIDTDYINWCNEGDNNSEGHAELSCVIDNKDMISQKTKEWKKLQILQKEKKCKK